MKEFLNNRIAIHFEVDDLDKLLDFYTTVLEFVVLKSTTLATGEVWVVIGKGDNHHIQLHFHLNKTKHGRYNKEIALEFSSGNLSEIARKLKILKVELEETNMPYGSSISFKDPIGNKLIFSEYY